MFVLFRFSAIQHWLHRRRKKPPPPSSNLRGGLTYPMPPPPPQKSSHIFLPFLCETGKNHNCTKLKGKIIINVTLIWFEGTGKSISFNSFLEFFIISDFKMRIAIIWHWFIKNLVGTWRQNDLDATSTGRIDVISTSCACWEFGPPWPPQYSKPSYAYGLGCHRAVQWSQLCGWFKSQVPG